MTQPAAPRADLDDFLWKLDNIELTTVGVDIGSATSHVMLAKVRLKRPASRATSKFEVVERKLLYRSPVRLTPFLEGDLIDAAELRVMLSDAYAAAGLSPDDVDTGIVILTGVALLRTNAAAIAAEFSTSSGQFVCASAGHHLEAMLAAQGSGAVEMSEHQPGPVLVIDVGGGTTKLAVCQGGAVTGTMAVEAGGRLVHWDESGTVTRCEQSALDLAAEIGLDLRVGSTLDADGCRALAAGFADRIIRSLHGEPADEWLLTPAVKPWVEPEHLVLSGGVASWYGEQGQDSKASASVRDLGVHIAAQLRKRLDQQPVPVTVAVGPMWSTVVGASQFSVQVSGATVYVQPGVVPRRNVPVVSAVMDDGDSGAMSAVLGEKVAEVLPVAPGGCVAVALRFQGPASYGRLRRLAVALVEACASCAPGPSSLVVAVACDIAASLGAILAEEIGTSMSVAVLDGITLTDLDFIDIGDCLLPANVYPLIIKSLVFIGS